MASIDNIIETPIIATEFVTDPAAPASGPGSNLIYQNNIFTGSYKK
jgi:hypothetical protein